MDKNKLIRIIFDIGHDIVFINPIALAKRNLIYKIESLIIKTDVEKRKHI